MLMTFVVCMLAGFPRGGIGLCRPCICGDGNPLNMNCIWDLESTDGPAPVGYIPCCARYCRYGCPCGKDDMLGNSVEGVLCCQTIYTQEDEVRVKIPSLYKEAGLENI